MTLPDPTPEMLERPDFNAVWNTIKTWDISVPSAYVGYCGATGSHVRAILDALAGIEPARLSVEDVAKLLFYWKYRGLGGRAWDEEAFAHREVAAALLNFLFESTSEDGSTQ